MSRPTRPLPTTARRVLWHQLWDRLLQPPRVEPGEPERIPTPEDLAHPEPHSCGEGERS